MSWETFWYAIIWFSVLSFTYISVVALIKGVKEMKQMFNRLR